MLRTIYANRTLVDELKLQIRNVNKSIATILDLTEKFQSSLSNLKNSLPNYEILLAEIDKIITDKNNVNLNYKTDEVSSIDYETRLNNYIRHSFPDKYEELIQNIELIPSSILDLVKLKDIVNYIGLSSDFINMSSKRREDFCNFINDYLSGFRISIFYPIIGDEYDKEKMNMLKKLSPSSKVSKVIYFGIKKGNEIILKAEVYVG